MSKPTKASSARISTASLRCKDNTRRQSENKQKGGPLVRLFYVLKVGDCPLFQLADAGHVTRDFMTWDLGRAVANREGRSEAKPEVVVPTKGRTLQGWQENATLLFNIIQQTVAFRFAQFAEGNCFQLADSFTGEAKMLGDLLQSFHRMSQESKAPH